MGGPSRLPCRLGRGGRDRSVDYARSFSLQRSQRSQMPGRSRQPRRAHLTRTDVHRQMCRGTAACGALQCFAKTA